MKRVICEECKAIVPAALKEVDLPFERGDGITVTARVNALVCSSCERACAIPADQTPRIAEALRSNQGATDGHAR